MNPDYFRTVFLLSKLPEFWPFEFAIITACNPMDKKLSEAENSNRQQMLLDRIGNKFFFQLDGCSLDHTHREQSFALTCSRKEALEIGKEFGQRAVFYVTNGNLELMDCKNGSKKGMGNFIKRVCLSEPE